MKRKVDALIPVGVIKPRKKKKTTHNIVMQAINFEKKFKKTPKFVGYDIQQNPSYGTPYIGLINGLQQGNGNNNRIGGEVVFKSIQYKALVYPNKRPLSNGSMTNLPSYAISIIYDNSPTGSLPSVAGSATAIFNGTSPQDLPLFDMSDRYTILFNEIFTPQNPVVYTSSSVGTTSAVQFDFMDVIERYRKVSLRGKFNINDNGNIGDYNSGAIYLVVRCSEIASGPADNTIFINMDTRIRFVDV